MHDNVKILVVDDERVAVRNLEHVLKKEGYVPEKVKDVLLKSTKIRRKREK